MAEIMKRCYETAKERHGTFNEGSRESSLEVAFNWLGWREEIHSHCMEGKALCRPRGPWASEPKWRGADLWEIRFQTRCNEPTRVSEIVKRKQN